MAEKPRAVLLDSIKPDAGLSFEEAGFAVETFSKKVGPRELAALLEGAQVLGIRSGPEVPAEVIESAAELLAIGCFCVGTDQVDKQAAAEKGVAVFNSPYENGRSVAELVMGATYSLMRRLHEHNLALHNGTWTKSDERSYELRGKVMGVVGFGNIGQQVAALAEDNDMDVIYYDKQDRPRLGNCRPAPSLSSLLANSDVVSVHVPGGLDGPVIGPYELSVMKPGSVLINTARAEAVDYEALLAAVERGDIAGAALDVFADEPPTLGDPFISPLRANPRFLLTPHIGGSTEEAQVEAARAVSQKLIRYVRSGNSNGAVNVPEAEMGIAEGTTRLAYIHRNEPGANTELTAAISQRGLNIAGQVLRTRAEIGYALLDLEGEVLVEDLDLVLNGLLKHCIRARLL